MEKGVAFFVLSIIKIILISLTILHIVYEADVFVLENNAFLK
jgi:hypothetical protein